MSDIAKTSVGLMKVGGSRAYHFTLRLDVSRVSSATKQGLRGKRKLTSCRDNMPI